MGNKKNRKSHPSYNVSRRKNKRVRKHNAIETQQYQYNTTTIRQTTISRGASGLAYIANHRAKIRTRELSIWQNALISEDLIYSNWTNDDGKFDIAIRKINSAFGMFFQLESFM